MRVQDVTVSTMSHRGRHVALLRRHLVSGSVAVLPLVSVASEATPGMAAGTELA